MFPYEKLEVYKKAYQANQRIYQYIKDNKVIPVYLKNQFGRASLSIMLNIAEGSARFSPRDRRNFLAIARGSVFECVSITNFLHDEGELPFDFASDLLFVFNEISRMLYPMIKNIDRKLK